MIQPLPVGDFEWMEDEELTNWKTIPCVLEVDLEYPKELHDLHNDYPLAPERMLINKVEKLVPNLSDKERYILHAKNLALYQSLGMIVKKIHRGIKFREEAWLEGYIMKNTKLRMKGKIHLKKILQAYE